MSADGGLGMLLGELLTVLLHDLPTRIVLDGGVGRVLEMAETNLRTTPVP